MKVGVLSLQGDFREHLQALKKLGVAGKGVRTVEDLEGVDGLIIPGGESTTIFNLMEQSGLYSEIKRRGAKGLAIYGTCAGAILLAKEIVRDNYNYNYNYNYLGNPLGLIDISIKRNAYGRQVDSFEAELKIKGLGAFRAIFIRAPKIVRVGPQVEVLAEHDSLPVMAQQKNILVSSFHPELTDDLRVHEYFLKLIASSLYHQEV